MINRVKGEKWVNVLKGKEKERFLAERENTTTRCKMANGCSSERSDENVFGVQFEFVLRYYSTQWISSVSLNFCYVSRKRMKVNQSQALRCSTSHVIKKKKTSQWNFLTGTNWTLDLETLVYLLNWIRLPKLLGLSSRIHKLSAVWAEKKNLLDLCSG